MYSIVELGIFIEIFRRWLQSHWKQNPVYWRFISEQKETIKL